MGNPSRLMILSCFWGLALTTETLQLRRSPPKKKKRKRKKNPQEAQKQPQDRAQVAVVQRMYAPSVEKIVLLALDLQVTFDMESVLVDGTLRS